MRKALLYLCGLLVACIAYSDPAYFAAGLDVRYVRNYTNYWEVHGVVIDYSVTAWTANDVRSNMYIMCETKYGDIDAYRISNVITSDVKWLYCNVIYVGTNTTPRVGQPTIGQAALCNFSPNDPVVPLPVAQNRSSISTYLYNGILANALSQIKPPGTNGTSAVVDTNYFRNSVNLTNLLAAGITTNAGGLGTGYWAMSNGVWVGFSFGGSLTLTNTPAPGGVISADGRGIGTNSVHIIGHDGNSWFGPVGELDIYTNGTGVTASVGPGGPANSVQVTLGLANIMTLSTNVQELGSVGGSMGGGSPSVTNEGALYFDGANRYVSTTNSTSENIVGSLTICMWAKLPTSSTIYILAAKMGAHASWLVGKSAHHLYTDLYDATGGYIERYGATTIDDNNWHHLAMVFDSANTTAHVYVDGVNDDGSLVGAINNLKSIADPILLGAYDTIGSVMMTGDLDEVGLWSRALSPAEINSVAKTNLYIATGTITNNLVALWHLDERTGVTTADSSGNGNTGTLVNTPSWVDGIVTNITGGGGGTTPIPQTNAIDFTQGLAVHCTLTGAVCFALAPLADTNKTVTSDLITVHDNTSTSYGVTWSNADFSLGSPTFAATPNATNWLTFKSLRGVWVYQATGGATGPQGPAGATGPTGTNGTNGVNGTNGLNGSQSPWTNNVNMAGYIISNGTVSTTSLTVNGKGIFNNNIDMGNYGRFCWYPGSFSNSECMYYDGTWLYLLENIDNGIYLSASGAGGRIYMNGIPDTSASSLGSGMASASANSLGIALANQIVYLSTNMTYSQIQAAINAIPYFGNGYSCTIIFSNGTYTITSPLTISQLTGYNNVVIKGVNADTTFHTNQGVILNGGTNAYTLYIAQIGGQSQLTDINVQFTYSSSGYGMFMYCIPQIRIQGCKFTGSALTATSYGYLAHSCGVVDMRACAFENTYYAVLNNYSHVIASGGCGMGSPRCVRGWNVGGGSIFSWQETNLVAGGTVQTNNITQGGLLVTSAGASVP